jgi:uncharacterized membrane protein
MIRDAYTYVATLLVILALDSVWLTLTGEPLYRANIGDLLMDGFRPLPAVFFYLLYIVGILVFVVPRADTPRRFARIALSGAFFGLVCYATYDLTNFATLKTWSLTVTLADMAWGVVLTAVGSTLGTLIGDRLSRLPRG